VLNEGEDVIYILYKAKGKNSVEMSSH